MRWWILIFVLAVGAGSPRRCFAADPRFPDWPCAQPKVPEISLAAVWAGPPLDDVAEKWKDDATVSALVPRLAARRTPLEEAEKTIMEFVAGAPAEKSEKGKLLFAGLFDTLNAQRASVMGGLRTGDAQTAPGRGQNPQRHRGAAGPAGRLAARPGQDRRTGKPAGMGDADFRRPAGRDQIRL